MGDLLSTQHTRYLHTTGLAPDSIGRESSAMTALTTRWMLLTNANRSRFTTGAYALFRRYRTSSGDNATWRQRWMYRLLAKFWRRSSTTRARARTHTRRTPQKLRRATTDFARHPQVTWCDRISNNYRKQQTAMQSLTIRRRPDEPITVRKGHGRP